MAIRWHHFPAVQRSTCCYSLENERVTDVPCPMPNSMSVGPTNSDITLRYMLGKPYGPGELSVAPQALLSHSRSQSPSAQGKVNPTVLTRISSPNPASMRILAGCQHADGRVSRMCPTTMH